MATYTVHFACGHTDRISLYGTSKSREDRIKYLEKYGVCPECMKEEREKKKEEEYQKARERAETLGWEELKGSEKQCKWAEVLRVEMLEALLAEVRLIGKKEIKEKFKEMLPWLLGIEQASFWIEKRDLKINDFIMIYEKEERKKIVKDMAADIIIYPEEQKTKAIAEIINTGNAIEVISDKEDIIIETLKEKEFKWIGGVWRFKITSYSGKAEDRQAEIGNALLTAGVPIIIYDDEVRKKAIKGSYEPRHYKWIYSEDGFIFIHWDYHCGDYYNETKRLTSARWVSGKGMRVKPGYYDEIRDFAESYDFKLTEEAEEVLKTAEEKDKAVNRVSPEAVAAGPAGEKLEKILKSDRDILDDLRDDD